MTPAVKRACLRALETPHRRASKAVTAILAEAKLNTWLQLGNTLSFRPEKVKSIVEPRMEALRRSGVVWEWKCELRKDNWDGYVLKIDYSYGMDGLQVLRFCATCSTRL